MKYQKKFRPYVRRAKPGDYGADARTSILLNFRRDVGWPTYVLVQRGCRHRVMVCGRSKSEVEQCLLFIRSGRMTFKQWAKLIQRAYRKPKRPCGKVEVSV